jgi:glycosyltransferase involved in cell wall biosynthesis
VESVVGRVKMKFSIIIPVYNAEKYIENTILETLNQLCDSFEIVLVDDGATDRSAVLCDIYAEKFPGQIRVIHQKNQGQLVARYNGIQAAKGEYCLFLDADDALQENCLDEMQALLEKYHNPDLVIYSFRYINEGSFSRPAKKICDGERVYLEKSDLYQMFFTSTLLNNVWTKLVRREVLLRCCIDIERYKILRCGEDRLHSMEILTQAGTVLYTDREWYNYRLVEGSVTRQFTPAAIERFNDSALYEITGEYLKKWKMDTPEWRNRMDANWVDNMLYVFKQFYLQCRDKKSVIAYDWQEFLPDAVKGNLENNPELNDFKKEFTGWIFDKRNAKIAWYIGKKETKKKLKALIKRK